MSASRRVSAASSEAWVWRPSARFDSRYASCATARSSRPWLLRRSVQTSFALLLLRLSRTCRSRSKGAADVSPPRVSSIALVGPRLLAVPVRRLQSRLAYRASRLGRGGPVRLAP
jgi:hypothetical protein